MQETKYSPAEIEARTGVNIAFIFEKEGEAGFRKRERAAIAELVQREHVVLSTGGGAVMDPDSRALLAEHGNAIFETARKAGLRLGCASGFIGVILALTAAWARDSRDSALLFPRMAIWRSDSIVSAAPIECATNRILVAPAAATSSIKASSPSRAKIAESRS